MKTFKEEIKEIISENLEIEHDLTGKWLNKTADQIIQSLLNRLPKELKEKQAGDDILAYRENFEATRDYGLGYNQCLKELTEIITDEEIEKARSINHKTA